MKQMQKEIILKLGKQAKSMFIYSLSGQLRDCRDEQGHETS